MKKNKTIAYLMAATLLVGGTFVGTKALFTDEVNFASELSISTGDVDLEITDKGEWSLDRNGNELAEGTQGVTGEVGEAGYANVEHPGKDKNEESTQGNFANNLKYGDKLVRTVTIQNVGTLNATNLNITEREYTNNIPTWIELGDVQITNMNGEVVEATDVIKPGESVKVELSLTVKASGQHEQKESQNSDWQENVVITLANVWDLTADQTTQQ